MLYLGFDNCESK